MENQLHGRRKRKKVVNMTALRKERQWPFLWYKCVHEDIMGEKEAVRISDLQGEVC